MKKTAKTARKRNLEQVGGVPGSVPSSEAELGTRMAEMEKQGRLGVGRRIAQIREGMGMNQSQFANQFNFHKNTLARYERGEFMPAGDFLLALNVAAGVNPAWILLGDEGGPVRIRDGIKVAPLDKQALTDVVQVVEEFLQERGLVLEPAKKAELLVLIYEDVREHEGRVDRARVLRLVKLAA